MIWILMACATTETATVQTEPEPEPLPALTEEYGRHVLTHHEEMGVWCVSNKWGQGSMVCYTDRADIMFFGNVGSCGDK